MQRTSVRDLREQCVWTRHCHLNSTNLRCCKSESVSRTSAASALEFASYSSANSRTISPSVRPSQRERISCAVSFSSTIPSGYSSTLLRVIESICNRTPFARLGRAKSEIVVARILSGSGDLQAAVGVMNCVEHGPEYITFELESTHSFPLKLARVAIFQGNYQRIVRIAPRLPDPAAKIVKSARINPPIELFESCKAGGHQIRRKKLGQR